MRKRERNKYDKRERITQGKERKDHIGEREKGTHRGKRERITQGKERKEHIGEREKGTNMRRKKGSHRG